jgi:ribonuclease HII
MLKQFLQTGRIEAGCDEAGRGCLAGPVFAAAVILPNHFENNLLNDSKQLSHKQRMQLKYVIERESFAFSVALVSSDEIDKINILNASILAMHKAIASLPVIPEFLLIDGNRFKPYPNIPSKCIVKGDAKFMSIAAASILAKTYRDEFMVGLSQDFPNYGWEKNKGYPTNEHRSAIRKYGISSYHRRTFKLIDTQKEICF